MTLVSIIIPAKDETENLPGVLDSVVEALHNTGRVAEVIIVAGTLEDRLDVNYGRPWPVVRSTGQTRKGKGNALACGLHHAKGDFIVMMDADGSHQAHEMIAVLDQLDAGFEFVKGSRFLPGGGSHDFTLLRRLGARGLTWAFDLLFGAKHTDLCYGLMGFRADMLRFLDLPAIDPFLMTNGRNEAWGDGFEIEALINCRMVQAKASTIEIPSVEAPRLSGESHLRTWSDGWRVLRTILTEWRRPRASKVVHLRRAA